MLRLEKQKAYRRYDTGKIEKAMEAVGSGLSQRKASAKYGVPQATISNCMTNKSKLGVSAGRPAALPCAVEKEIAVKIGKTAEMRGLTKSQILSKVGKISRTMNISNAFKSGTPSQH